LEEEEEQYLKLVFHELVLLRVFVSSIFIVANQIV